MPYHIIPSKSNIDWIGRKVTNSHCGIIVIKSDNLAVRNITQPAVLETTVAVTGKRITVAAKITIDSTVK